MNLLKIALISDIHGNNEALSAVLDAIAAEGCDRIVCLGDVATLGPQPCEVLESLRRCGADLIMGNHDAALLHPHLLEQYRIAGPLTPDIHWCLARLGPQDMSFLEHFDDCRQLELGPSQNLLAYHGSPRSNVENLYPGSAIDVLRKIFSSYSVQFMAGGHTHIQMLLNFDGHWLINPGSVGQPFHHAPREGEIPRLLHHAEWAMLSVADSAFSVELKRTSYDINRYCQIIEKSTLPVKNWLLDQYVD